MDKIIIFIAILSFHALIGISIFLITLLIRMGLMALLGVSFMGASWLLLIMFILLLSVDAMKEDK